MESSRADGPPFSPDGDAASDRAAACGEDRPVRASAAAAVVAWIALWAFAQSRASALGAPWPRAGTMACAAVLAFLAAEAATGCACTEARMAPPLATPALLLSIHWSTLTVMRRACRGLPESDAGISDAAVPFAVATVAGGAALLVQPSFGAGFCLSSARRALVHLSVGSWMAHASLSMAA